jgi:hypothetical protein
VVDRGAPATRLPIRRAGAIPRDREEYSEDMAGTRAGASPLPAIRDIDVAVVALARDRRPRFRGTTRL